MIEIKETSHDDLKNIMSLWNDGKVMFFVGYPQGLNISLDQVESWYNRISKTKNSKHFSIYDNILGYLGESFYNYDEENNLASMDIKILPKAQKKGVGYLGLKHAINELFKNTNASKCYVEPHPNNISAWKLYMNLGFEQKERPSFLEPWDVYLELTKAKWQTPYLKLLSSEDSYLPYEMLKEIPVEENGFINPAASLNYSEYKQWLKIRENYSKGISLAQNRVPDSIFWLIHQGDYIGLIKLRHYLNNDLKKIGGHIGYSIRPSKRNLGYGTEMLKLGLLEAKKLNINKVLITINKDNSASIKVALKNQGKIIDENDDIYYIECDLST